jgi:2-haloacid dehalogenase
MIRYVLLDLDDTIFDFHMAEAVAVRDTLQAFGVDVTDAIIARYSEINDAQWKRLERGEMTRDEVKRRRFEILFEELGIPCDAERVRIYYENRLGVGHFFLPGAERMLADLAPYDLYLVSNGTTAVQNGRLASAGIAPLFKRIFLSEAIGYVKPQKEFFDACFAEIPDFDPAQAIILGDSLTSDILGGINAGVRTCWFNPKGQPRRADITPDFEIRSLDEFVPLIKRI